MTSFESDSAVEELGPGRFGANLQDRWWVVRGPHGGYLAAIILRALERSIDDPSRPIRSFTTHFVAAPDSGPLEIVTATERAGRSMTFMSARAEQNGKLVATAQAAFSGPWQGFEFDDAPPPQVPPPDEGIAVPREGDGIPRFLANFDMRWCVGQPPFSGAEEAVLGGWLRMIEPSTADAPMIACFLDAWAPAVFPRAAQPVVAPTIDLTMHFRTAFPLNEAKPHDFYLGHFSSRLGREGFFEEDGALWAPDGRLIAQSRQLALALT